MTAIEREYQKLIGDIDGGQASGQYGQMVIVKQQESVLSDRLLICEYKIKVLYYIKKTSSRAA
jgi:hypothetical protein